MKRLQEDHSPRLVEEALEFIQVRLSSRTHLQPIAAEVAEHRSALEAKTKQLRTAIAQRVAATGEIVWRDDQLDSAVMNLSRNVLAKVNGNRKDPLYQKLFPIAPSTAMKGVANTSQTRFVRGIIDAHARDGVYADFDTLVEEIQAAADAVDTAIAARDDRYAAEAQANRDQAVVQSAAVRFYNQLHPRLLLLEEDRALVESFFYQFGSGSGGGSEGGGGNSGGGSP